MQGRGNAKRHTMANPEEVHSLQSAGGSGVRTRRTGLLTVMERPPGTRSFFVNSCESITICVRPVFVACFTNFFFFLFLLSFCVICMPCLVIPPEVVMEVEARRKRNHMPPMLSQRKLSRHAVKPHLPTVQELQGLFLCFFFILVLFFISLKC